MSARANFLCAIFQAVPRVGSGGRGPRRFPPVGRTAWGCGYRRGFVASSAVRKKAGGADEEIEKLTVVDLKAKLTALGLDTKGKKQDLVERLQKASAGSRISGRGSIQDEYKKMSPREHVLLRPEMYIGSMEKVSRQFVVPTIPDLALEIRDVTYVPGLVKIFDEILVNAADNKLRDDRTNLLKVDVKKNGTVTVENNGEGIPVAIHPEHQVYVPELVMGTLLTGSNFDDTKSRITGGRHGYGAKLTNIFSVTFKVETADSARGLMYQQTWYKNMSTCDKPVITPLPPDTGDYTKVTFDIDLKAFRYKALDDDTVSLFARRVLDVAGCHPTLRCSFNGVRIKRESFEGFAEGFLKLLMNGEVPPSVTVKDERWKVVIARGPASGSVSYVNSINTIRGGTHVSHITDQVVKGVLAHVRSQHKDLELTERSVHKHVWVMVSALIENPSFDSQAKESLVTAPKDFGSECNLSKSVMDKIIADTGIAEEVVDTARRKQDKELEKARPPSARKGKKLLVAKLEDANFAGTHRSGECTLILTEGDSAKALAVAGLSVVGRDKFGVFPLKGKPLNVREATHKQLRDNKELQCIRHILGLQHSKSYDDPKEDGLRYGSLMLMTDQDHDGSHIKGLIFNIFHHLWPSLLQRPGFMVQFITPLVKATRASRGKEVKAGHSKEQLCFYSSKAFEAWRSSLPEADKKKWNIKYYKGLGTSTTDEGREYFEAISKHRIDLVWQGEPDGEALTLAFGDDADKRKDWLSSNPVATAEEVDHSKKELSFHDFVHKELIQFSHAHMLRSIPSVLDGCKPSQRKVLYACFKKKLFTDEKVSRLAGYISEQTAYHHGEVSLHATIIKMGQDFVGANNLPLLVPQGQFGTRLKGGDDHSDARYLYTRLSSYTRSIFREEDDALLTLQEEDGMAVEPENFMPIIPTVLVNGAEGIATGWSTSIPMYNPFDVIDRVVASIKGATCDQLAPLVPWYAGFYGTVESAAEAARVLGTAASKQDGYVAIGKIERVFGDKAGKKDKLAKDAIRVTELPVGRWTEDFKELLDKLCQDDNPLVETYKEHHTVTTVDFLIYLTKAGIARVSLSSTGIDHAAAYKVLNLVSKISMRNMVAFASNGCVRKYSDPRDIVAEFVPERRKMYQRRRDHMIKQLERRLRTIRNRVKFVDIVLDGGLVLKGKQKLAVEQELLKLGFSPEMEHDSEEGNVEAAGGQDAGGFDYLLRMPIMSLTAEKLEDLKEKMMELENQLKDIQGRSAEDLWLEDLVQLRGEIESYYVTQKLKEEAKKTRKQKS